MSMNRRRFLGFTVGAAAGGVLGSYGGTFLGGRAAAIDAPIRPARGTESWRLSVCRACPGGCGVRVRCLAGRPVKVEGNPLHPVSGGRLCPKGQASLQLFLHPDRLARPLRRVGPRGSLESFREATWDEALGEIALRLSLLRRQRRPEALVLVRGFSRDVDSRLARRFLAVFGSPNDVDLMRGDEAAMQALQYTQGVRAVPSYDLQGAEYALLLGGTSLETASSPVHFMRAFGEFRQGRTGRRGRMVHVGSRRSLTCAIADDWVQVRPGTEGILALGMAAVMVAEGLHDREFVAEHATGFEDVDGADGRRHEGLRSLLKREFHLERVAQETGVPVDRILQVSREFAAVRPAVALGPRTGPLLPGQLFDHLAAHVLNALVGNIDGPGGVLVPEETPLPAWPALPEDEVAADGLAQARLDGAGGEGARFLGSDPEVLAEALFAQAPYRAEAVLLLDADPALTSTAPDRFAAALEQVPLVVSICTVPDDTSLHADWILPKAHPFESWNLELSPPGVPFPLASVAEPVVATPRGEARQAGRILLDLAQRIGGPVAAGLSWSGVEEVVRRECDGLYDARVGAIVGTEFDEAWIRLMERAGWWAPGYRSKDELWDRARESGGWWDPFYDHQHWKRVLRTESGRFELRPDVLALLARRRSEQQRGRVDLDGRGGSADGGLALELFEPLAVSAGIGGELPFLQEILDPVHQERWETWVELHPDTAAALGVRDRAMVRVVSSHASVRARARVTDGVVPGVAAMPVGLGKRAGGRWARGRGSNPLRLLAPVKEELSGLPDTLATRVRVVEESRAEAAEV